MKRIFDLILAFIGLILFGPLGLIFSILIKCEDGGSIFYAQERWGKGGRKFKAYKFRTMVPNAQERWGEKAARENDERFTRVGKFLRATAMDELPQLLNILKGEMSFVGPRALPVAEIDPSFPQFFERHQIRPGLTGPAQIYASRDAPFEERFRYDLDYIQKRTFGEDLRLLFLSLWITLRGRWESRAKKI